MNGNNNTEVIQIDEQDEKTQRSLTAYSAPLPPASEFERYEKVCPGAADRIIKLAENQNRHRTIIEKILVISDSIKSLGGLFAAFLIVIAGIIAGVYLIIEGKSPQGLAAIFIPLATVIGAFIYQTKK